MNELDTDKDPSEFPETMAYAMGYRYGKHPNFTADGVSTPEGQPYLWSLYTEWLLDIRSEDATMKDFKQGFLDGVTALSVNKEQQK